MGWTEKSWLVWEWWWSFAQSLHICGLPRSLEFWTLISISIHTCIEWVLLLGCGWSVLLDFRLWGIKQTCIDSFFIFLLIWRNLLIHEHVLVMYGCKCIYWDDSLLNDFLEAFFPFCCIFCCLLLGIQILCHHDRIWRRDICRRLTQAIAS